MQYWIEWRKDDDILLLKFIGEIGPARIEQKVVKIDMCPFVIRNVRYLRNACFVVDDPDENVLVQISLQVNYRWLQRGSSLSCYMVDDFLGRGRYNFYPCIL